MSLPAVSSRTAPATPALIYVEAGQQRSIPLDHTPFTIGRKIDRDLVIADPRVSREHATIVAEGAHYFLVDSGSRHGSFINDERVQRQQLQPNDKIEFGMRGGAIYVVFSPEKVSTTRARELLTQISGLQQTGPASDLEKLTLFLEAARKLNTTGVVDEILATLLEATLRLTRAERGFVFLRDLGGGLRLAAGRNALGQPLFEDTTISHSILREAAHSASEFLVSDTSRCDDLAARNSIVAYDLRSVICIPLRKTLVQRQSGRTPAVEVAGVLYLDSRFVAGESSQVSNDILRAIATEAAALVENAHLVEAEEAARRYQQELSIAASIQQRLMAVKLPEVPFAKVRARNISCREIGGDFFDAVRTEEGLTAVIADVCGKGVSAALLASILQGMIYTQLVARVPLQDIVRVADRFLRMKDLGEKYATAIVATLAADGVLHYVNCGHVQPLLIANGAVSRLDNSNLPVGLVPGAEFESSSVQLRSGDRVVFVSDGVTEAVNALEEFFGEERLEETALGDSPLDNIFAAIRQFCGETALEDDCTVLELTYCGY